MSFKRFIYRKSHLVPALILLAAFLPGCLPAGILNPDWFGFQSNRKINRTSDINNNACVLRMAERYESLLEGTLPLDEREKFFLCFRDGLKLFIQRFGSSKSPDGFTTEDITKFFYNVMDFDLNRSWELAVKTLVIKKILLGGEVSKLENRKLKQLLHLVDDYENFFALIARDIPFFRAILTGKTASISEADFNKSLKKLHNAVNALAETYKKKKVSYSVSDLRDINEYARILSYSSSDFRKILKQAEAENPGPASLNFNETLTHANALGLKVWTEKEAAQWKNISLFLYFWGNGVFESSIKGENWPRFAKAFNSLLSLAATWLVYLSGKDIFTPAVFPKAITSLKLAIEAISPQQADSSSQGFPASHLTGLIEAILSQAKDSKFLSTTPISHLAQPENKGILSLVIRHFVCFSLSPKPQNCQVTSAEKTEEPFVSFLFPDGRYDFYRNNNQKWTPFKDQMFQVTAGQLESLKTWLEDLQRALTEIRQNEETVAAEFHFSHWRTGFFGYDSMKRLRFGFGEEGEEERETDFAFSLLNSAAFLKFFASPFLETNAAGELFIVPSKWNAFTEEMLPVLAAIFQIDYNEELQKLSLLLFDYGDQILNSANANGRLEFSELLDVIIHLDSAQTASRQAFQALQEDCNTTSLDRDCVSRQLFFNTQHLSHFKELQEYVNIHGMESFISSTEELLPETITTHKPLLLFFLIVQLEEFLFYAYDFDGSRQIEYSEFQEMVKSLKPKFHEEIPYIQNEEQAEVYLRYAIEEGHFPFLMEKGRLFGAVTFSHWVNNPERYENLPIQREGVFLFLINLYNLNKKFN